ncbi:protein kinase domain-containing protein [Sphingobium subterraneum]|uniref:non-specific serine/threonine protein kinase n=1 Tax=Sphingobium subterraneum TaxID=627688 RepID=A0A841J1K9_9SPHN|nr:protein kinase [Sphingobium subterraneum]MBB6124232.1 serine/threonine-protein kinase [Sphingobium subterraneum]
MSQELRQVGRYRIDETIGEGAMAHVFLGHDPSIDRPVAIKILKPEFRGDPHIVQRFLAESRAAGMLSHPHIVTIFDVGEANGIPYIAMEHLKGRPLEDVLAEGGRMSPANMLALAIQITDALAFAHDRGVIHRDVKPSNILVCDQDSTAKLLDFGIARMDGRDAAQGERDSRATQAGQVMGTPRYMSPEQAMGMEVDARSDLFSLGSVLYEMLTGKPAFAATGLATLALQITQQQPLPVRTHVPDCSNGTQFILTKLLAKKPSERFASATQLKSALMRELEVVEQGLSSKRRGMPLKWKLPLTFALTASVALGLGMTLVLERENAAMEHMAKDAGTSMTDFVARNAALLVADNAGLPSAEQDWLPLQAFVETAAQDRNVEHLVVVDDSGIIRASNLKAQIGTRYADPAKGGTDFRFVSPLRYAGANFGTLHTVMSRAALDTAVAQAKFRLLSLALFVVATIAGIGFLSAQQLSRPLSRLRRALDDMSEGNASFRLSHPRNDEMGSVFDAFNRCAQEIEARSGDRGPVADLQQHLSTRIQPAPTGAGRQAA